MLERERELYGQLRRIHNPVENYLGISARGGRDLIDAFERSAARWNITKRTGVEIGSVDCASNVVVLGDASTIASRCIFVATGVRRRELGIPGEREFIGRGVLLSGSAEREIVKGKRVVVAGGGDAAAENALILAEHAERVFLVHRRDRLSAREEFVRAIADAANIETIFSAEAATIGGDDVVRYVDIRNAGGHIQRLEAGHFIARVGVAPNSELVASQVKTDTGGYILVDSLARTSAPSVFAVGDVANPASPTISTATGTGATAAKAALRLLRSELPV